ncbi:MAG: cytochrome P460 family protein [Labilithrix sp.]|nr:cytochrome P460 family protein [Labilithrix sp.]MCW5811736.1 cytochrome P460 family protein [Labilithrix sp.]
MSDKPSGGRTTADGGAPGPVDGAASLPASYRATFAKVNKARFVSTGHASGRWEVDVWANELAQKALAARSREVPVGAIVVQEHFERSSPERTPGPVMVMEKRAPGFAKEHGDWRWAVVGSQGQLVQDGVIESCAGCHDDAPMDGLFPIVE